ncbi:hypothetical protein LC087_03060 [Bacillus carboniphilus]|uniref:Uncharacterized protein n=1 Tax=Bacillus carboniphilus TaxID=86663 RepID=A0ABY9JUX7_9BACI|nr:hypothetical protein [Bacillus carboniphilus]WLR43195.1 hypothetical protein LC087_03060 [Bacillus carboniphilus]
MYYMHIILAIIGFLIAIGGLIVTWKDGRKMDQRQQVMDTQINKNVQKHPYLRNPIFITYMLLAILTLAYIIYNMLTS